MAPMSLTPRSRLIDDSARSPRGANRATTANSPTALANENTPTASGNRTTATMNVIAVAPSSPSHVFLGLTDGASGRLPQFDPTTNADTSYRNVSPSTASSTARPSS